MGSYAAYQAQQVDRLTGRVKELEAEIERLRDGIQEHRECRVPAPRDDRRLWALLDENR